VARGAANPWRRRALSLNAPGTPMEDTFRTLWSGIAEPFDALPDGIPDGIMALAFAAVAIAVALALHGVTIRVARRFAVWQPTYRKIIERTHGPLRLAFVMLGLRIAAAAAPLPDPAGTILARVLQVALIVLLGWMAMTAINIAADVYLRRFRIDVEDNLLARKHVTQIRILKTALRTLIVVVTAGAALMSFEPVRQYGISLMASAGIAGVIVGFAARPLFSSLIAGMQIAMTQPFRLDDAVLVENEMGFIEEITATYVVIRLWDWRRMIVPLTYFLENPFQNWTREGAGLIGSVFIRTDYSVPIDVLREKFNEIVKASNLWDGKVLVLQITDAGEHTIELRGLCSARNAGQTWDLRCEVREKLIAFIQAEYPRALPHVRQEIIGRPSPSIAPGYHDESDLTPEAQNARPRNG
jgi:small-conductance mechanosensitive channel